MANTKILEELAERTISAMLLPSEILLAKPLFDQLGGEPYWSPPNQRGLPMDGETDERRQYQRLTAAFYEVRNRIAELPDLVGEDGPYQSNRKQLLCRLAELERRLVVLSEREHRQASAPAVAGAEVVADEPIVTAASRVGH